VVGNRTIADAVHVSSEIVRPDRNVTRVPDDYPSEYADRGIGGSRHPVRARIAPGGSCPSGARDTASCTFPPHEAASRTRRPIEDPIRRNFSGLVSDYQVERALSEGHGARSVRIRNRPTGSVRSSESGPPHRTHCPPFRVIVRRTTS
jgi:hypothetical protein